MVSEEDRAALAAMEARVRAILPEEYQDSYQDVQPVSMGSAGLKYSSDGRVAWDLIWGSFCDLAMAGGPPHKGHLLEPGTAAEIAAAPGRYGEVTAEIGRGITMTTGLPARPAPDAGWVRSDCGSEAQAAWLVRAIVMENVSARCEGRTLDLPAGPGFQLHKEIKNVVTVIAKTCHYWVGHMSRSHQQAVGELLSGMSEDAPLITPAIAATAGDQAAFAAMTDALHRRAGLVVSSRRYAGWLGVECADVQSAVWMMRALVVNNILSRREGTILFVPVNAADDPGGDAVVNCLLRIRTLWAAAAALEKHSAS